MVNGHTSHYPRFLKLTRCVKDGDSLALVAKALNLKLNCSRVEIYIHISETVLSSEVMISDVIL